MLDRRLAVAPMMDCTDRHARYLMRILSPSALLYTEMVPTGAVLHGDRDRFLGFDPAEHPLALQLGGSEAAELAEAARIGCDFGYDEINLNVGCPSDRVTTGRFGACLMAEPEVVARAVAAMRAAVALPVTVKTRIGIDDRDSYEDLTAFVRTVAAAGCRVFIIHARKAWLTGLSPKENREIPPLRHDLVHRLKSDFPDLAIILNGGLTTLAAIAAQRGLVDGVMIGRAAYDTPWFLAEIERGMLGGEAPADRDAVLARYLPYVERAHAAGVPLARLLRPLLGLYHGMRGARAFRRRLSEHMHRPGTGAALVREASALIAPQQIGREAA